MDIDEAGVNRLQTILAQNQDLAKQLAAAFNTARSSMMDFIQSATEELSNQIPIRESHPLLDDE